jgi:uncharacterized protein (UPF0332 family)
MTPEQAGREFQRYLTEAEYSRNVCDYDIGPVVTYEDALHQIGRARQFVDTVSGTIQS